MARNTTAPTPAITPTVTASAAMPHQASGRGSRVVTRTGAAQRGARGGAGGQHPVDLPPAEAGLQEHLDAVLTQPRGHGA